MNAKTLVLIAFAAWSALSWRWYVCNIKQVCNDDAAIARNVTDDIQPVTSTAPIEETPPPAVQQNEAIESQAGTTTAKSTTTHATGSNAATTATKPFSDSKIDEVQLERVKDRMVVYFPYKSIRREDNDAIDDYLARLAQQLISSGQKVSITGHTDFVGEPKDNLSVGLRRAESIRAALIKKGVPKGQIRCYSKGDTQPVATNDTPLGRYKNRRVEIRVGK